MDDYSRGGHTKYSLTVHKGRSHKRPLSTTSRTRDDGKQYAVYPHPIKGCGFAAGNFIKRGKLWTYHQLRRII